MSIDAPANKREYRDLARNLIKNFQHLFKKVQLYTKFNYLKNGKNRPSTKKNNTI